MCITGGSRDRARVLKDVLKTPVSDLVYDLWAKLLIEIICAFRGTFRLQAVARRAAAHNR